MQKVTHSVLLEINWPFSESTIMEDVTISCIHETWASYAPEGWAVHRHTQIPSRGSRPHFRHSSDFASGRREYEPRGSFHGLAIELKKDKGGRVSQHQKEWLKSLENLTDDEIRELVSSRTKIRAHVFNWVDATTLGFKPLRGVIKKPESH